MSEDKSLREHLVKSKETGPVPPPVLEAEALLTKTASATTEASYTLNKGVSFNSLML
jgi:hypothetical protein